MTIDMLDAAPETAAERPRRQASVRGGQRGGDILELPLSKIVR